jgi:quinol monooxygenase YgiN/catechol 2,3-dioxygenase-like lactoylglutathione lyase family enzyme
MRCAGVQSGLEELMELNRRTIGLTSLALTLGCAHGRTAGNQMFGLIRKMAAAEGRRDELVATLTESAGEMSGRLSYVVAKDSADASILWVTEVWDSAASHRASLRSPAVRAAIARTGPLIASMEVLASTEPVAGQAIAAPPAHGHPPLDLINIVTDDFAASLAFYRRLGLPIHEGAAVANADGPFHANVRVGSGAEIDLDSARFAQVWNTGWRGRTDLSGRVFLNFRLPSRADVDARYAALRDAGYRGLQPPTDAFWGARFAAIEDPQGVGVGLQSPPDDALRSAPPNF